MSTPVSGTQHVLRADEYEAAIASVGASLRSLTVAESSWHVEVRPELVVEIAFDGVQSSPRYPAGMALRFARVLAHRPDKSAAEADTIETVASHHVVADDVADPAAAGAAEG